MINGSSDCLLHQLNALHLSHLVHFILFPSLFLLVPHLLPLRVMNFSPSPFPSIPGIKK